MKTPKKSHRESGKPTKPAKNPNFYVTIAAIGGGMAVLFFVGFWLMSLLDPSKNTPTIATSPAPVATTQPNNIAPAPIATTTPAVSPTTAATPLATASPATPVNTNNRALVYRVVGKTNFKPSAKLQKIVDLVVNYSVSQKLPTSALSVTLIDTKTGEKADYNGSIERYPASVVKLFWLVAIYQQIGAGTANESALKSAIEQMIFKSDNQGASQVLDTITNTQSTSVELSANELNAQKQQRQNLNEFFRQAGYSANINVSQKTFPIPQENMMEPKGLDKQLRGDNPQKPIRNKLTTDDAARLMYEIVDAKAIAPETSKKMRDLLTRNTDPNFWKKQPPNPVDFNPIESFFGEGLPASKTEDIVSKAGWTSASRQEVAFIKIKDKQTKYILAVFGDDAAYGKSKKVFPEISNLVYNEMRKVSK
jgi:beta-lactamase class A